MAGLELSDCLRGPFNTVDIKSSSGEKIERVVATIEAAFPASVLSLSLLPSLSYCPIIFSHLSAHLLTHYNHDYTTVTAAPLTSFFLLSKLLLPSFIHPRREYYTLRCAGVGATHWFALRTLALAAPHTYYPSAARTAFSCKRGILFLSGLASGFALPQNGIV